MVTMLMISMFNNSWSLETCPIRMLVEGFGSVVEK
jgi:hypothetical protein